MTRNAMGNARSAADSRVMTREQAQALVERAIKLSKADAIQVNVGGDYSANIRFADNRISTAGGISTANLNIQSSFGPKHAVVSTNDFTDAGLERAVRQSEALAKLAPDDPEAMPRLGPQQYENLMVLYYPAFRYRLFYICQILFPVLH